MKNENNQNTSGSQKDENSHNEKIPLWLQGLQEHKDEDTNPIEVEKPSAEARSSELPVETPTAENHPSDDHINLKGTTPEGNLQPDWLSELADIDPARPPVLDQQDKELALSEAEELRQSLVQGKEPQEFELSPIPSEDIPKEVDEAFEDLPPLEEEIELREPEEMNEAFVDHPADEEEHDVHQPEEVEITEAEEETRLEEAQPQDEDLPPWLQEMITESQEPEQTVLKEEENQEAAMLADEPTEPIEVMDEPLPQAELEPDEKISEETVDEFEFEQPEVDYDKLEVLEEIQPMQEFELDEQEITSEPPPSEWVPEQAVVDEINFQDEPLAEEIPAVRAEGDTHPMDMIEPESEEEIPSFEEQPEDLIESEFTPVEYEEEESTSTLPEDLLKAKEMLFSGDIDQALSLIRSSGDQSAFRCEIKTWLVDAAQAIEKPNTDFWELLGDLALEEEQPDLAFNAYSNAIQSLLKKNEG